MNCFLSREADFLIRLRRDLSSGAVRSVQSWNWEISSRVEEEIQGFLAETGRQG